MARWMGLELEEVRDPREGPRTRQSDRVPDFNFDGTRPTSTPAQRPESAKRPLPQSHDS